MRWLPCFCIRSLLLVGLSAPVLAGAPPSSTFPEVVDIPGGTFTMGSRGGDARADESPHTVTVGGFAMAKHEVTVAEFGRFIAATGYLTDADRLTDGYASHSLTPQGGRKRDDVNWRCDAKGVPRPPSEYDHPVVHVSWNDAVAYAAWLSRTTGQAWRLPTEAEWEYAARAGREFLFAGSDSIGEVGWYTANSGRGTHPVAAKRPNGFGLYDMTGNVWEWCSDWFGPDYYRDSPRENPTGPASGTGRVLRGGSWGHQARYCRVSHRHNRGPDVRNYYNGFRVVLVRENPSPDPSDTTTDRSPKDMP